MRQILKDRTLRLKARAARVPKPLYALIGAAAVAAAVFWPVRDIPYMPEDDYCDLSQVEYTGPDGKIVRYDC